MMIRSACTPRCETTIWCLSLVSKINIKTKKNVKVLAKYLFSLGLPVESFHPQGYRLLLIGACMFTAPLTGFGQCAGNAAHGYTAGSRLVSSSCVGDQGPNPGGTKLVSSICTAFYTTTIVNSKGQPIREIEGTTIEKSFSATYADGSCVNNASSSYTNFPSWGTPGSDIPGWETMHALAWLSNLTYAVSGCDMPNVIVDKYFYTMIVAPDGEEVGVEQCLAATDPVNNEPPECGGSSPNPIAYRDGNKWLLEHDVVLSDLEFTRKYSSNPRSATTSVGSNWAHNFEATLFFSPPIAGSQSYSKLITALRSDGSQITFLYANEQYTSTPNRKEFINVVRNATGAVDGYTFYLEDKSVERYNANGKLTSVTDTLGRTTQLTYANGDLVSVTSPFGRTLTFSYLITPDMRETATTTHPPGSTVYNSTGDIAYVTEVPGETSEYSVLYVQPEVKYPSVGQLGYLANPTPQDALPVVPRSANRLLTVTDANGNVYAYNYDDKRNLVSVTYPGAAIKNYVYENGVFTHALTGIIDEKGVRYSTYEYDSEGRAVAESLASGAGYYSLDFTAPNTTSVYDPMGNVRTYGYQNIFGGLKNVSQSQPDGSGCLAATSSKTYNPDATVASETDFNGITKAYQYDPIKSLPTKITEASGQALARETNLQWHTYWKLPTQVDEVTKVTTNVYNGDSGVQCAPANALTLKDDGTQIPIPVLCSQTVRAKLAGVVDSSVPARVSSYTYDVAGRVLTQTDANNHTTSYTYYSGTSFTGTAPNEVGHTIGDLQSITDAAGHVSSFNLYDRNGKLMQSTDTKGIVTNVAYTPRGLIASISTTAPGKTARVTSFGYDAVGLNTGVAMPDGTSLSKTYDDAHRLISVSDGVGNKVSYTLDALGNRINESYTNQGGVLQRTMDRVVDALNRVQTVTGQ
jgi:YD repeat-containing protein